MLWVDEIFASIQGESSYMGLPTVFVRLFGCNVGCSYCDTKQKERKKMSLENIVNEVRNYKGITHVCVTGGEPLLQDDCMPLVYELQCLNYQVSIETSGCVPIEKVYYHHSYKMVMDVKCPSSGVSGKNIYENLLSLQHGDEVKFVIADRADYDFMLKILRKYPTSADILISPMFGDDLKPKIGKELVDWIIKDGLKARMQIQMHKVLEVK